MRKSLFAGMLLLTASVLIPSCVEGSEDPPASDPRAISTEDEPLAGDEAAGSGELEAAGVAAAGSSALVLAGAFDCSAGALCLWDLQSYQGRRVQFTVAGCTNLGPYGFNGVASSWFNRHSGTYTLYRDSYCQGASFEAPSGSRSSQMGPYWDNNLSSICRGANCP